MKTTTDKVSRLTSIAHHGMLIAALILLSTGTAWAQRKSLLRQYVDQLYRNESDKSELLFEAFRLSDVLDQHGLEEARDSFRSRYDVNETAPPVEWGAPAYPNWGAYEDSVKAKVLIDVTAQYEKPDADITKVRYAGVMFHYGVLNNRFIVAVSLLQLKWENKPDPRVLEYDTTGMPFYEVKDDGSLKLANRTKWRNEYWKTNYVNKVHIRHPGQAVRAALDLVDAEGEVFMREELQKIYLKNALDLAKDVFVVTCIADPNAVDAAQNAHRVVVHIRSGALDRIDNRSGYPSIYSMRGAELGSPCPPRCGYYDYR